MLNTLMPPALYGSQRSGAFPSMSSNRPPSLMFCEIGSPLRCLGHLLVDLLLKGCRFLPWSFISCQCFDLAILQYVSDRVKLHRSELQYSRTEHASYRT